MKNKVLIELCCGSIEDCLIAIESKVDRIELNSALELGGLTPSLGTFKEVKKLTNIPICVMVRPRGAGFNYSEKQYDTMLSDAQIFLEHGADGIVFGFLDQENKINTERTKKMVELIHSYEKEAIFHKAIDGTINYPDALEILYQCHVDRVLTSGAGKYPEMNCSAIYSANMKYQGKIAILPGGGVRESNVIRIIDETKTKEIHMTSKKEYFDPDQNKESTYLGTDKDQLDRIIQLINQTMV